MNPANLHNLNIANVLFGPFSRLSNITRFSLNPRLMPESVAEHSFWTSSLAFLMALHYEHALISSGGPDDNLPAVDWKALAFKSGFHDMEETGTGDFPRPFKHSSPELLNAIEKAARTAADRVAVSLSGSLCCKLFKYWEEAKDETIEGRIVQLADYISVVRWGIREQQLGNRLIADELCEMRDYIRRFNAPAFDFIRPYVEQAYALTEEMLNAEN